METLKDHIQCYFSLPGISALANLKIALSTFDRAFRIHYNRPQSDR
jgi:hypothetical protein